MQNIKMKIITFNLSVLPNKKMNSNRPKITTGLKKYITFIMFSNGDPTNNFRPGTFAFHQYGGQSVRKETRHSLKEFGSLQIL